MFYGWKLCLITLLGNFLLQGSIIYMMNAFMDPLTLLHGWTRAQINMGMSCAAFLGALSIPLWSALALRYSVRLLMTLGAFLGGFSLIMLGITNSLLVFSFFYTLAWVSGQGFGGAIGNVLINSWFYKAKGKAFGLSSLGTSFSGALMPFLLLLVINYFDVRTAFIAYGMFVLCAVPLCWFFIRDTPEEMGLHVDNIPQKNVIQAKPAFVPWKDVLRNRDAYIFAFIFGLALMVGSSVVSQLQPRIVDLGISSYQAMFFSCLTAFFLTIAKYIWGRACDIYSPLLIIRVLISSMFFALLLIFLPANLFTLFLFSFCFGCTTGGVWSVMPASVAFYFGKEKFIFYYRLISTFILLKALGYTMLGISQSLTQSYNLAYIFFACILCLCFALSFMLKQEQDKH